MRDLLVPIENTSRQHSIEAYQSYIKGYKMEDPTFVLNTGDRIPAIGLGTSIILEFYHTAQLIRRSIYTWLTFCQAHGKVSQVPLPRLSSTLFLLAIDTLTLHISMETRVKLARHCWRSLTTQAIRAQYAAMTFLSQRSCGAHTTPTQKQTWT